MTFKISDFQAQLDNTLTKTHNPDSKLSALVNKFVALPNANAADFDKLVTDVQNLNYSSAKTKVSSSDLVNLLVAQQAHLQQQTLMAQLDAVTKANEATLANAQMSVPVKVSSTKVMECVNSGNLLNKQFTLKETAVAGPVANYDDYLAADIACKSVALSSGAHYLTLTGEVSGCKGPFLSASDTYFNCMIDF